MACGVICGVVVYGVGDLEVAFNASISAFTVFGSVPIAFIVALICVICAFVCFICVESAEIAMLSGEFDCSLRSV